MSLSHYVLIHLWDPDPYTFASVLPVSVYW